MHGVGLHIVGHFTLRSKAYQLSFSEGKFVNKELLVKLAKASNETTISKHQLRQAEASSSEYLLVPIVKA